MLSAVVEKLWHVLYTQVRKSHRSGPATHTVKESTHTTNEEATDGNFMEEKATLRLGEGSNE